MNVGIRNHVFAMVAVVLFAFAIGVHSLNAYPVWGDELSTLTNIGAFNPPYSPADVIKSLHNHTPLDMPLYFVLAAIWAQIAGWSQFALRLLSLFAGVCLIAAVFRLGRDVFGARTGIVAAWLVSTNAYLLIYFVELRTYSILMFLFVIHLLIYFRVLGRAQAGRFWNLPFFLTSTLLLYAHMVSIVLIVSLAVSHAIVLRRSRRLWRILASWAASMAVFLPYFILLIPFIAEKTDDPRAATVSVLMLANIHIVSNGWYILIVPLVWFATIAMFRNRKFTVFTLAVTAAISGSILIAINWQFNMIAVNRMRYFHVPILLILILCACGLSYLQWRRALCFVFLAVWSAAGLHFANSNENTQYAGLVARAYSFPPLQRYVHLLQDKVQVDDYVIGFTLWEMINKPERYSSNNLVDYYMNAQLGIDGAFLHTHLMRYRVERDVRDIVDAHPHILLAHDPSDAPLNYARTLDIVQKVFIPCVALVDEADLLIRKYTHPLMDCDREPTPIAYENGIKIVDYVARYEASADRIQALTWWDIPDADVLDDYNISLQLITKDWRNVRQVDRHLYDNLLPWSVIELPTTELPAGLYRLILVLYERQSSQRVFWSDQSAREAGNSVSLLEFSLQAG